MNELITNDFLPDILKRLQNTKLLADNAIAQISDDDFFKKLGADDNSIAIIVKHISGNMLSRWTDFLASDGEKPTRNRDTEFEIYDSDSKKKILDRWEIGWKCFFDTLSKLIEEDFHKMITIRSEQHSVFSAINRQSLHYSYHVGQIVLLAKHFKSNSWNSLSVPKGKTKEYNEKMKREFGKKKS